jgi:hypothetical protein
MSVREQHIAIRIEEVGRPKSAKLFRERNNDGQPLLECGDLSGAPDAPQPFKKTAVGLFGTRVPNRRELPPNNFKMRRSSSLSVIGQAWSSARANRTSRENRSSPAGCTALRCAAHPPRRIAFEVSSVPLSESTASGRLRQSDDAVELTRYTRAR